MPKENGMFKEITRVQCEGTWTRTLGDTNWNEAGKAREARSKPLPLSPVKLIFRFSLH